ncbi:MAG: glycosyltransferase family 4 protein [Bdellovibrionales bacterium]
MTRRPLTVLQVLPALVTGGVERGTVEVAAALVAAGHKALVASSGGPMVKEIEAAGGTHIELPLASKSPFTIYRNVERIASAIWRNDVDIVHARSRAPAWSAWGAAYLARKPFVTTFHNAYGAGSAPKRFYNSVMARGDRVIAISQFVGDYARSVYGVTEDRLRIIPRGVDTARFDTAAVSPDRVSTLREQWKLPPGMPVIMLPGRMSRWKGHLVLVDALAKLNRTGIVCMMVGGEDGSCRKDIRSLADQKGIGGIVRLADDCRDMPAAYMLADIVVSPSTRPEGFGRVIIEAQAMGRPVIATDHGGARESVVHGKTGWLVPPGDAEALARALADILSLSPEARTLLARTAADHVRRNFTTARMTGHTLEVYEEVSKVVPK